MPSKKRPLTISFEFFPPKTPEGLQKLYATAVELAALTPSFFSVTFGAGGSTQEGTLETVMKLQQIGIEVAPHLACVGLTRAELITILHRYQSLQVKRLVALRGDLPSGMGHSGELKFANELVALARETTGHAFHIEVAAYPEIHPQAETAAADLLHLKKKIDAGANSAITQYFFNADAYFYFVDQCRKNGIDVPIVPGIMPITHFDRLVRFSAMCGAEIPQWVRKRLENYTDPQSIEAFGQEVVMGLCDHLIRGGVEGLHFYTLNHSAASLALVQTIKSRTE